MAVPPTRSAIAVAILMFISPD